MALSEHYVNTDEIHPIDIVETLAEHHEWDFDRVTDDQIAMAVEAQWRTYSITLAWSAQDETLRLIWRYGLVLSGGQIATPEQIDRLIGTAVGTAERFYPAFQLVTWGERSVDEAMQVAIAEAYGRA